MKIDFEIDPREITISNEYVSTPNKQIESENHGQSKMKFRGDSLFFYDFQKLPNKNDRGKCDTQDNFSFKGKICFYKKHVIEFIEGIKAIYETEPNNYKKISIDSWKKYKQKFLDDYCSFGLNDLIYENLTTTSYRGHEQALEYNLYKNIIFKIAIPYASKVVFFKVKDRDVIFIIPKVDFSLLTESYFIKIANKNKKSYSTAIRKYQSKYRDKIISRDKACVITSIETLKVSEAAHLKPYSRSNEKEKIDPMNGLLLSATFHKFLDEGLISFDPDTGEIILSTFLPKNDRKWLIENMKNFESLLKITEIKAVYKKMRPYIKYHYDHIFYK